MKAYLPDPDLTVAVLVHPPPPPSPSLFLPPNFLFPRAPPLPHLLSSDLTIADDQPNRYWYFYFLCAAAILPPYIHHSTPPHPILPHPARVVGHPFIRPSVRPSVGPSVRPSCLLLMNTQVEHLHQRPQLLAFLLARRVRIHPLPLHDRAGVGGVDI